MIVRDEEANLPACLESASGLFDEIVVVDTGSTDRTPEIARAFGARVFDFVWVDDFAAARNAALARATGDYVFWLDADDRIDVDNRLQLQALFENLKFNNFYILKSLSILVDGTSSSLIVDHARLFPNCQGVRWTGRAHEQILPSLQLACLPMVQTDIIIRHIGYIDPLLRRRKLDRNQKILMAELEDHPGNSLILPGNSLILYKLGMIAMGRQDPRSALHFLRPSLSSSASNDPHRHKLYALIARAHQMSGEPRAALAVCEEGLMVDPDDAELLFHKGISYYSIGDRGAAEKCWRRILMLRRPECFSVVPVGIYGHATRRYLAMLAEEREDYFEASKLWAEILAECPGDPAAVAARIRVARRIALSRSAKLQE